MFRRTHKGWTKHLDFILLDAICLALSLYFAHATRNGGPSNPLNGYSKYDELAIVMILINYVSALSLDTYKNILRRDWYQGLVKCVTQALAVYVLTVVYLFVIRASADYSRIVINLSAVYYAVSMFTVHQLWKVFLRKQMKTDHGSALLIMAPSELMPRIIQDVREHNYSHNQIIGAAVEAPSMVGEMIEDVPVVASFDTLTAYAQTEWVDEVLVCMPYDYPLPGEIMDTLVSMGITVHLHLNRVSGQVEAKQTVSTVGSRLVLTSSLNMMKPYQAFLKRSLDILGGLVGCAITAVLYAFIAPRIKKESPGPAFFAQTRIGQNGKPFKFYKFRSMYMDAEARREELMAQNRVKDGLMFKLEFDPRIIGNRIDENGNQVTGIGEFIRRTSLDEFPQFWNVLKGDMSLVGTRPPLPDEYAKYSAHHKARLATKPGITGMWQTSGRSNIMDFEEVVKLDTQYINNWSLGLDIKILLKTVFSVLKRDGSM